MSCIHTAAGAPVISRLAGSTHSDAGEVHRPSGCDSCSLRSGCLPRDLEQADLDAYSAIARLKRTIRRSAALFRAGDRLVAIYIVRSGTFKTMSICDGGKQGITGFYLPGDIIGLDALNDSVHAYDAIALEESEVCVILVHELERMASRMAALQKQVVRALSREVSRAQTLHLTMGFMDAEQRVRELLLNLAERYHRLGYASDALLLHMTRDEIANHLGLSSETVSRVISRMRRKGLLTVHQRHIGFTDPARLIAASAR
ncbi:MAG: helix-turn-helix domain-containing protein [Burkholderiales bacterium]